MKTNNETFIAEIKACWFRTGDGGRGSFHAWYTMDTESFT